MEGMERNLVGGSLEEGKDRKRKEVLKTGRTKRIQ